MNYESEVQEPERGADTSGSWEELEGTGGPGGEGGEGSENCLPGTNGVGPGKSGFDVVPVTSEEKDTSPLNPAKVEPWPEAVDGKVLLDELAATLRRFVVMPKWAAETLALWIVHTYAFKLRDVTTYVGLESPLHRCGKSTLVTVLSELANRAVVASNVSSPAFFRVIEDLEPTLLIDEADTFLQGNEELRGILNSGYTKGTAYVLRVINQPAQNPNGKGEGGEQSSGLASFSCWCPKVVARIGRLPQTLADRCILFRMQRKTSKEKCERLRRLKETAPRLKRQCARFVRDHGEAIGRAEPEIPPGLNDRAADIWEPLLVLAELAGGEWAGLGRQAATGVSAGAEESNPIGALLLDMFLLFTGMKVERMFSRTLVDGLNGFPDRAWREMTKMVTDRWLAKTVSLYGVRPRTIWIGEASAKGYLEEEVKEACLRYVTKSHLDSLVGETKEAEGRPLR